jgi:hypothetical protein
VTASADGKVVGRKTSIENRIETSTGLVRDQCKYRLVVWDEKMEAAKNNQPAAR